MKFNFYGKSIASNVTNDFRILDKAFLTLLLIFQLAYPTENIFVKLTYLENLGKSNYINVAAKFTITFKLLYLMLISVMFLLSQPQQNDSMKLQKATHC